MLPWVIPLLQGGVGVRRHVQVYTHLPPHLVRQALATAKNWGGRGHGPEGQTAQRYTQRRAAHSGKLLWGSTKWNGRGKEEAGIQQVRASQGRGRATPGCKPTQPRVAGGQQRSRAQAHVHMQGPDVRPSTQRHLSKGGGGIVRAAQQKRAPPCWRGSTAAYRAGQHGNTDGLE